MAEWIQTDGIKSVIDRIQHLTDKADLASRTIVTKSAVIISDAAKKNFRPTPAGSVRTSKKSGHRYFSSAGAFQPRPPRPTNRTHNLQTSIKMQRVERLGVGVWQSLAGPNEEIKYAAPVEFGTNRSRPFPYMRPALEEMMPRITEIYKEEWRKELL